MTQLINYFITNSKGISQIAEMLGMILIVLAFIYLLILYRDKKYAIRIDSIKISIMYILIIVLVSGININIITKTFLYVGYESIDKVEVTKKNEIDLKERIESVKENINKFIKPDVDNGNNIIGNEKLPSKINTFNKEKQN